MDETAAKMLSLHVPSRHSQAYPEVELSPLVQSAALMGVGLLFRGTCHRRGPLSLIIMQFSDSTCMVYLLSWHPPHAL